MLQKRHCSPTPPRPVPTPEGSRRVLGQERTGRETQAAAGPEAAVKATGSVQGRRPDAARLQAASPGVSRPLRCCGTPPPPHQGLPLAELCGVPWGHPHTPRSRKETGCRQARRKGSPACPRGAPCLGDRLLWEGPLSGVHFRDSNSCPSFLHPRGFWPPEWDLSLQQFRVQEAPTVCPLVGRWHLTKGGGWRGNTSTGAPGSLPSCPPAGDRSEPQTQDPGPTCAW